MDEHFIILGLPRSMTAWVSCFLTCGEVFCQHELAPYVAYDDAAHEVATDLIRQPFPVSGICDSGMLPYWEGLMEELPHARFVWIDRPEVDCINSLHGIGLDAPAAIATIFSRSYEREQIKSHPQIEQFTFDELQTEDGARRLWNYCAPHHPLPPAHLRKMMSLKVTVHPKVYAEAAATLNQLTAV